MTRREVLALAAAALPLQGQKDNRLACNSWPFRAYFDTPEMHRYRDPKLPLLTQAEFPEFLADHFDIHNVEFLPQHFGDTSAGAIRKVKDALGKSGSRCCNLMGVDLNTITTQTDLWVDIAATLESPSITVAISGPVPIDVDAVAGKLKPIAETIHSRGMKLLFHNDDIRRESAEILTATIQKIGPDRAGACPDFGNFAPKSPQFALAQLRMLAPYASNACHAKDGIAQGGKFYGDDFAASMRVMREAGFRGVYSLEFEGLGDPMEGVGRLKEKIQQQLQRG